jgi:hypothetical protein
LACALIAAPAAAQTPPPTQQTPPPTQQVPPPTQQAPPPTQQAPPPAQQALPPAQQQTPPPTAAPMPMPIPTPQATTVEFTTATRLPGITLQPGQYVFKLGEPKMKQNVVEVYSSDGSTKIATLLTVDYAAPAPAGQTLIAFEKTNPPALRAVYLPGNPIGREFVYTEAEAGTVYTAAGIPVLYAAWDPDDPTIIGTVDVKPFGTDVADAAKAVADAAVDVAQEVGDKTEDIWDDITDNAGLVNPTDERKAAERQLDAAEHTFGEIEDRLDDAQEAPLKTMRAQLESLEDAFEKDDASWMTHYTAVIASLDALAPERPVGTSGGTGLDVMTQASLGTIRAQLKVFHDQAMK